MRNILNLIIGPLFIETWTLAQMLIVFLIFAAMADRMVANLRFKPTSNQVQYIRNTVRTYKNYHREMAFPLLMFTMIRYLLKDQRIILVDLSSFQNPIFIQDFQSVFVRGLRISSSQYSNETIKTELI